MKWLTDNWKTIAAIVYLLICILDFMAIPIILAHWSYVGIGGMIGDLLMLKDYPDVMKIIAENSKSVSDWVPFTLRGGGLFHISFGAILTGSILGKKN